MALEKSDAVRKSKTPLGRRRMLNREPKTIEDPKILLLLKGHATSQVVNDALGDLHILKKPLSRKLQRKNDVLPFEAGGESHLENLVRLNDASLFALGNHTKKRPHNLVLGRTFGYRILDMIEFGVTNYRSIPSFQKKIPSAPGSMPCILFNGDDYHSNETTEKLQSLLFDVFRGPHDVENVSLAGIDRAITFTLSSPRSGPATIAMRHYAILLKKAGNSKLPRVELEEIGPSFDLTLRRTQFAPEAMMKEAMRTPKDPRVDGKRKNISKNEIGDKLGRIHLGKQDLSGMALARMKGLGRKRSHQIDDALLSGDSDDGSGAERGVELENDNEDLDAGEGSEAEAADESFVAPGNKRRRVARPV
jgi:ribosome production factor 2